MHTSYTGFKRFVVYLALNVSCLVSYNVQMKANFRSEAIGIAFCSL